MHNYDNNVVIQRGGVKKTTSGEKIEKTRFFLPRMALFCRGKKNPCGFEKSGYRPRGEFFFNDLCKDIVCHDKQIKHA